MSEANKVPKCPNCGAKFARDKTNRVCGKCGVPDEIITMGGYAIRLWNKKQIKASGIPKRERKRALHFASKKKNKHGRSGVKS